jgi:dsDNA-binding SOS-regulon protein
MMERLLDRAEAIATSALQRKLADVADQLRAILGNAAVQVTDNQVVASGRSLMNRWLSDPSLRFFAGGLK